MSLSTEDLRKELEEIRRLKEELKEEISEIKDTRARSIYRSRPRDRTFRIDPPVIDLSGLTESIQDMMEELSDTIEDSVKGIRLSKKKRKVKSKYSDEDVEYIPPERVARIISPLGSEERLRILNYLKTGSKTFNELEVYTGKTGSSLTHHLNPLQNASYVIKGEVRGTYYITVEGRLAYRLAQWLTDQVEGERLKLREKDALAEGEDAWY